MKKRLLLAPHLLNVRPGVAASYLGKTPNGYAVFFSHVGATTRLCSDFSYNVVRKFGLTVFLAFVIVFAVTALGNFIKRIVQIGANKEMIRPTTRRAIALVKNKQTGGYLPHMLLVREAVCPKRGIPTRAHNAVSSFVSYATPSPASVFLSLDVKIKVTIKTAVSRAARYGAHQRATLNARFVAWWHPTIPLISQSI